VKALHRPSGPVLLVIVLAALLRIVLAGRQDLLGRRGEQVGPSYGEVLPSRWIE